jgi:hypothetical protein
MLLLLLLLLLLLFTNISINLVHWPLGNVLRKRPQATESVDVSCVGEPRDEQDSFPVPDASFLVLESEQQQQRTKRFARKY